MTPLRWESGLGLGLLSPGRIRTLTWMAAGSLLLAGAIVASGGRPVPLFLAAALVGLLMLRVPMLAVVPMIVAAIIWLIGDYSPGGSNLFSLTKVTILLALLAWLLWAWRFRVAPTYAPHMLFLGGYLVLVIAAPFITPAFEDSLVGIGKYVLMVLPYLIVANLAITRKTVLVVAGAISGTATLSAMLAMVERFMPGISLTFDGVGLGAHLDDVSLDGGLAILRVTGGIGDANWFSYTMATALPLCILWFKLARRLELKALVILMGLLQMAGIVFSYTRTPLIGLAGAVLYLVWRRIIPLAPLMALALAGLVTSPMWVPDGLVDRFFSEKYLKEGSTPMRREIFSMALELIQERPVLGWGYQQFGSQFIAHSRTDMGDEWARRDEAGTEPAHLLRAHNLYLDIWVQNGGIGLVMLLGFFGALLYELHAVGRYAHYPDRELAICLSACLLSFMLCGLGGHSQELKIFWLMAGLAAGLRRMVFSRPLGDTAAGHSRRPSAPSGVS